MKGKILIISSEQLTPENTLGSIFELAQAKILKHEYNVSIVSVQNLDPLAVDLKMLLKSLAFFRFGKIRLTVYSVAKKVIRVIKGKQYWSQKYQIEGVDVYAGYGFNVHKAFTDQDSYDLWLDIACEGFTHYRRDCGDPDLVHAHGRFLLAGLAALKLKRAMNIRYVYTEHSSRFPSGYVPSNTINFLNEIIDNCSRYIAVSNHLLIKVIETLDRDITNSKVVYNVLDPIYQGPVDKHLSKNRFKFINVANLEHRKGIDILLRAFKRAFYGHPTFTLDLVGDGPVGLELKELCQYLELDHVVQFHGEKSKPEIARMLEQSNVFVFPSRFETFGVSVIEALSRGCPVIVTACGGPEEFVTNFCGIIVEPENENKLVSALKKMSENFRKYDRDRIHKYAIQEFGSEKFLKEMREVYGDIMLISRVIRSIGDIS